MSKDTINVELPIKAYGDDFVKVDHAAHATREWWREIAADGADTWSLTGIIAPAVVAWIERDEFEPLDVPDVGRQIRVTLRDGREETFEVKGADDYGPGWVEVWKVDSGREVRYIQRRFDATSHTPWDIIAWEYVDEPKFKAGDWVLVGEDPDVHYRYLNRVGFVVGPELSMGCYRVQFPDGVNQLVTEGYLRTATPKDVKWKAGDTVPAGTFIGREWVGESVLTGHRSLFGVPDSRTAATDRKIVWLGESND